MKAQSRYLSLLVVILLLMTGGVGALADGTTLAVTVASKINYQGRLTDASGTPLSGSFSMQFLIYDDPTVGTLLWDSGIIAVNVDGGLFNVALSVDPTDFNGQALWLMIGVHGEWLFPRQELVQAPYALSLRPGAQIQGIPIDATDGWVLDVQMNGTYPLASAIRATTATGSAIYGNSNGYGLYGYSESGNAVVGRSIQKTAGVFSSDGGYGIRVSTSGIDTWDHAGYFSANMGYGIYATSTSNQAIRGEAGTISGLWQAVGTWGVVGIGANGGVFGSGGSSAGVSGHSTTSYGVYGESDSASENAARVWGYKGSGDGTAVRGLKYGGGGIAVYGTNWGNKGSGVAGKSTNWVGVWGESEHYNGVWGETSRTDHNYGFYTPDNLYSLNYHLSGAVMQVVQNGGRESLEPGDVVVFSGIASPLEEGGEPIIQVAKATAANSTAVAGVVYSQFNIGAVTGERLPEGQSSGASLAVTLDGPVAPGGYLLVVVQGPVQVKVSALSGIIKPGELLASAGQAGTASKAAQVQTEAGAMAIPGTVLGKALETLEAGQELIYIYVTLQ